MKKQIEKRKELIYYAIAGVALIVLAVLALAVAAVLGIASFSLPAVGKGCVAVVPIKGELVTEGTSGGMFGESVPGSESIVKAVEEADSREDVKAIVLYIDSPGGSVVASREIYEAVNSTEKPTVSYFREVAASGAYEVAAGSDYIVSEPDTITGSIGVRSTVMDLSGLFEKLGINSTNIKSGAMKDMGDSGRPMTDEERVVMQGIVDEIFQQFRSDVIAGRKGKLDMDEFEKILDARILTGKQAKKIGLVDEIGNKKRAIAKAWEMAGEEGDPDVCEMSIEGDPFAGMFSGMAEGFGKGFASGLVSGQNAPVQMR